ncbi:autotransporter domain-containing protein [Thermodesulfobacteriota bacterium]
MAVMKKVFIYVSIIGLSTVMNAELFAQNQLQDNVYFKDGSIIRRDIIDSNMTLSKVQAVDDKLVAQNFKKTESQDIKAKKRKLGKPVNSVSDLLQMHTWEFGPEMSHITYEEPSVIEEKGFMYGISGSYTYHNKYMLRAEGRFSYGQVDYASNIAGNLDNIDDYMIELRALGGYDFPISNTSIITPFIGIGYRYLNDDTSGMLTSTGAAGYERESNYYYCPIGIETITKIKNSWLIGLILEYEYFWKGRQISHFSDFDARYSDVGNDQNDGYGFRGSIRFQKKSDRWIYVFEPFIRYWDIEKSEKAIVTVNGISGPVAWEPENSSTEIGIVLQIKF